MVIFLLSSCFTFINSFFCSRETRFARIHGVGENYFETAIKNIKQFIDVPGRTTNVGIGGPVNENNFASMKQLPELAMSLGADFFQAKLDLERLGDFEYSEWWYEIAVPFFEKQKRDLQGKVRYFSNLEQSALTPDYCHAHRVITAVTADGRVAFCKMRRDDFETTLGNIHTQSLRDIMDSERHHDLAGVINLDTCNIAQVHCPYRKTIQAIEIYLRNPESVSDRKNNLEHNNFF